MLTLVLLLCFSILAIASPAGQADIDKRRDKTCTRYPTENKSISVCKTATDFCTDFLNRPASTSTVYTATITRTAKQDTVTLKATSTVSISRTTTYSSTTTVNGPVTIYVTSTLTTTARVTRFDTATTSVTETDTATETSTSTALETLVTTITARDPPCTSVAAKRAIEARAAPVSCGVKNSSPSNISGACACFLDKTISTDSTTTKTPRGTVTTKIVPTTATTTISALSTLIVTPTSTVYTTVTPATLTIATITSSTETTTAFTVTGDTTTVQVVTTSTSTKTSTSSVQVPTCDPNDDVYTVYDSTYVSSCNTHFQGYTIDTVDAQDFYECIDHCETVNYAGLPTKCTAISFNADQCNNNCELKYGVDVPNIDTSTTSWQSSRLVSPGIGYWGNKCLNNDITFGDIVITPSGVPYQALCSVGYNGNDLRGYAESGDELTCVAACDLNDSCVGALTLNGSDDPVNGRNNCYLKYALQANQYSTHTPFALDQFVQVSYYKTNRPPYGYF